MRRILCALLSLLLFVSLTGQKHRLPITNYTNKAYGRNYEATNWCIVSDQRNFIYAGNANGVLEYDGSDWRFIPVRQGAGVRSMDISSSNTIYVGSQQEFGFLSPNSTGSLQYTSLSDRLPDEDRFFTDVWMTSAGKDFVVFQAYECLFIFKNDSILPVYPWTKFHTSFIINDQLYTRESDEGLKIYRDGDFSMVPDGELFADLGIFGMFPMEGEDRILIITQEKGFFVFDPSSGIEHLPTGQDDFLINAGIFGGILLGNNTVALSTMYEGVVTCDLNGRIITVANKNSGLQDNDVKGLWEDTDQNIWCALGKGISKIEYSSPVSFYQESAGLEGSVHALTGYEDRLYAGTTSGLFIEKLTSDLNQSLSFVSFPGIRDQVWDLEIIGGTLVVGTSNGIYAVKNGRSRKVSDHNAFAMLYLEKENLLLAGSLEGLVALRPGSWTRAVTFPISGMDIKSIARNNSSYYNAAEIWVGTALKGTAKILLYPDLSYDVSHYGMGDALPEDWVDVFAHGDSILFGTRGGVLHFMDEYLFRQMLHDSLKDNPVNYRGYFEPVPVFGEKSNLPLNFQVYTKDRIWAVIDNEITLFDNNRPEAFIEKPFRNIDLGELNLVWPDGENSVWFGASEGLARFNTANLDETHDEFYSAIRSITVTGDSVIFNGTYQQPRTGPPDETAELFIQPPKAVPVLSYRQNNLTFTFSSPYYNNENRNLFSWVLDGTGDEWSQWTERRITSYTNLREGNYTFRVRVLNIYGDLGVESEYSFTIRPPWFRTIPAFLSYLLLISLFVYVAVRLGQYGLRKKNFWLEGIVAERTEEIRHQNIELAAQKKEITDSIYYAERIQRAILPLTEKIEEQMEGYFILFKPKDIVSGDFYWIAENGNKIIVTAVDCTGHGVPGAFMSMLGVSFLNKIILENNITRADRILNDLRDNVISALKQTGKEGEARDGMDMALVVIDLKKMTLEFAGANNPLYMIREKELSETKPDRMPIAFHTKYDKFSYHTVQLKKGDTFYLFSDGYADQFGGRKGKKLMYKPFKRILLENSDKPMDEIREILDHTLESWKAPDGSEGTVYEQVDDILVIGVRI